MADEEFEPDYDDGDFGGDDIDGEVHELDHRFLFIPNRNHRLSRCFFKSQNQINQLQKNELLFIEISLILIAVFRIRIRVDSFHFRLPDPAS